MVKVSLMGESVVLRLDGEQKLWAVKSRLPIPLESIEDVQTDEVPVRLFRGFRVGTYIPGMFVAGTFYTRAGKWFCYFRDRRKCVTLTLKGTEYRTAIFEVDDKEGVAEAIRSRLRERTRT